MFTSQSVSLIFPFLFRQLFALSLLAIPLFASGQDQAERPDLLFQESWQQAEDALGRPSSNHASNNQYYLAGQSAVTSEGLELSLYGFKSGDITVYAHEGRIDLWTGLAGSPVALTLKTDRGFMDLRGLARMQAIVRTNHLHVLHPVIRLADGVLAVGSQSIQTDGAFLSVGVAFENQDWFVLDPTEVSVGAAIPEPDLSRVSEVGFANLAPGGGHGQAGWSNISTLSVYADIAPR